PANAHTRPIKVVKIPLQKCSSRPVLRSNATEDRAAVTSKGFKTHAMTRIDVMMLLGAVMLMAVLAIAGLASAVKRAHRITCINYLMQMGLATRVWEGDHTGLYPMQ